MNPDFPTLINSNLIKSAGNKLKWIGYLLASNMILWMLYFTPDIHKELVDLFDISYSTEQKILAFIMLLSGLSSIASVVLLILAGKNFIHSSELPKGMKFEVVPPITEVDGNGNTVTKYFFPNGALKKIESFNKENQKNGWWEYYSPTDGKLKYKELYENGDYRSVFKPE